jgi:hypothetical protein
MTALRHSGITAGILILVGAAVFAQTPGTGTAPTKPTVAPTPRASVDGPASAEIRALRDADQADRKFTSLPSPDELKGMVERDKERRAKVRELLNEDKLVTPEDFDNAALIFQHGETTDDYLTAHELSIIAVMQGRFNSLPALSEDRFLDKIGRKQRFGTQFGMGKNNKLISHPVDGGQPTSVTDALRADFLVPTVKEWQKDGMNAVAISRNRIVARMRQRRDPKWREEASKRPIAAELKKLAAGKGPAGAARVLQIYRNDALWTPDDYYHAATVLSRRGDSSAWILAHELASVAAMQGKAEAKRLAAETLDLFLVSIKQPQRYGTVPGKPTEGTVAAAVRAHFGLKPVAVSAAKE